MSQDRVDSSTEQGENTLVQHRAANRQRPHRSILMMLRGFTLVQRIWGLETRSSRGMRSEVSMVRRKLCANAVAIARSEIEQNSATNEGK